VTIEDEGALADRIEQLMQDPARADAMGKAGRKRVKAHFNIEREAREIFVVYERLWASARSTSAKTA
jgi:glycosyltransferase involved in cell wall biosynthesis